MQAVQPMRHGFVNPRNHILVRFLGRCGFAVQRGCQIVEHFLSTWGTQINGRVVVYQGGGIGQAACIAALSALGLGQKGVDRLNTVHCVGLRLNMPFVQNAF